MATFVSTFRFTDQGIKAIGETTKRAAAVKAAAKKMKVKVTDIYWTLGPFDGLVMFDAPDDETATALMLHVGRTGKCSYHHRPGVHGHRDGQSAGEDGRMRGSGGFPSATIGETRDGASTKPPRPSSLDSVQTAR